MMFQSTRPRGARRMICSARSRVIGFNPRAHAGRDVRKKAHGDYSPMFQSTRPRGARLRQPNHNEVNQMVSIHAPTRGATPTGRWDAGANRFNPRAHAGRDLTISQDSCKVSKFQSTRPRGARHQSTETISPSWSFQSTRPRGARQALRYMLDHKDEFQSTRPRGARLAHYINWLKDFKFQSTRPRGARREAIDLGVLF